MASAKIFRINYKSDFILTLNSDAGWMTPFCIKFWTGAPSQAYYVQWDGETYTHCAYDPSEPTKLLVQFDDHHLPIGDLKFQIAYHFTVADFPNDTEDEVINPASITTEIDGETYHVMLDFTGETAPEIEFSLPAYANEAQRIANEQQRIANEEQRIAGEQTRINQEQTRQQNEQQRINQEQARVNEYASLKSDAVAATGAANDAAALANQKAQLAADKAALAQAAATLANQKAQLAADKAALANAAAQLANVKAALAQQKAEYAQQQGHYAKDLGEYAKNQGDYAGRQGDTALADHQRAQADHGIAVGDHTQAGNDHTRAESDHGIAVGDHTQAGNDHTRAESDHGIAVNDHTQAGNDHTRAESDHGIAADDHTQAGNDHTRAESDHTRAESDHAAVELYVDSLGVFDLSKHNAVGGVLATYADLSAALTALNALDSQYKYGGMSFKFVSESDHRYVQYICMSPSFSTNPEDWAICGNGVYVENPDYIFAYTDEVGHLLFWIATDGSVGWAIGIPAPVKTYIDDHISEILTGNEGTNIDGLNKVIAFLNDFRTTDTLSALLNTKVNKVEGKGLIDEDIANNMYFTENPYYLEAKTDAEGKILSAIYPDGSHYVHELHSETIDDAKENIIDNIVYRKRRNSVSANIEEVIDINGRKYNNRVFVGIFASDYLALSKKYDVYESADGITYTKKYTDRNCNVIVNCNVNTKSKFLKIVTTNISDETLDIGINVWNNHDYRNMYVASSESNITFKNNAHFVCDGTNDEVELDEATTLMADKHCVIHLGNGNFYIDSFIKKDYPYIAGGETIYTTYGVITHLNYNATQSIMTIVGFGKTSAQYNRATRIFVRDTAFSGIPSNVEPVVISGPEYGTTSRIVVKELQIRIESNQHKVVCINGQHLGSIDISDTALSAGDNAWSETLPAEGCIGLRGVMGDCNNGYILNSVSATAFHVGFQLGGEHLVACECGTRFCYYGYTFGEYDYGSAYSEGQVTDSHPLTLINCADEGSRALPKFVKSGMYSENNFPGKQEIDMIGFNMEVHTSSLQGAVEVTSGAFCGSISFAAYGSSNSSKDTGGSGRRNRVDIKFWASDNDGKYFRTVNSAHAEQGTTTERLGYWAQKMQKYYDTDLNKMLVCTNETNQVWKDFNGNIVNN